MLTRRGFSMAGAAGLAAFGFSQWARGDAAKAKAKRTYEVMHSDAEWRQRLTADQYEILRRQGTEQPFSSPLLDEHRAGIFACVGCDNHLFSSTTKFDSGTGWPSFWQPLPRGVDEADDHTLGMVRTEISCHRCGGHLGHVFDDGPKPTGLRYCMDGVALKFIPGATA